MCVDEPSCSEDGRHIIRPSTQTDERNGKDLVEKSEGRLPLRADVERREADAAEGRRRDFLPLEVAVGFEHEGDVADHAISLFVRAEEGGEDEADVDDVEFGEVWFWDVGEEVPCIEGDVRGPEGLRWELGRGDVEGYDLGGEIGKRLREGGGEVDGPNAVAGSKIEDLDGGSGGMQAGEATGNGWVEHIALAGDVEVVLVRETSGSEEVAFEDVGICGWRFCSRFGRRHCRSRLRSYLYAHRRYLLIYTIVH